MAESSSSGSSNGVLSTKRRNPSINGAEHPRKKAKPLFADGYSTSDLDSDDSRDGVPLPPRTPSNTLTINEGFAKRFEHNKRREELHKLEEKYGKRPMNGKPNGDNSEPGNSTDTSSDSEDEDDEGILASGDLDQQVQATLEAIKAKDPRVYDKHATFYTNLEDGAEHQPTTTGTKEKPMYLNDYHRKNILQGVTEIDQNERPPTFGQEQDTLKAAIIQEMHASVNNTEANKSDALAARGPEEEETDDEFLVAKPSKAEGLKERPRRVINQSMFDITGADQDPEKFLSDFMTARAWVPHAGSKFVPFESDDEEEEKRADEFEEAYNLRFENPSATNETLVSHARDAAARYSVRREATTGRKRARETDRAKREAERQNREEEKAQLRKLRIADAEEKIQKIKDAAGLRHQDLELKDWSKFLDEGWNDKKWAEEMRKRFGDTYYADRDVDGDDHLAATGKSKVKKPKWKDDIDIHDLVPEFEDNEQLIRSSQFILSDIEPETDVARDSGSDYSHTRMDNAAKVTVTKKQRLREKNDRLKQARKERHQIEQLVDKSLDVDNKLADMGSKHAAFFRYRETSPVSYGLTAQDILMASDSQLNQYAGLKKLAAFRDSSKKSRDRKRLGKKARLRQWRRDTFGNELGPQKTLADLLVDQDIRGSEPILKQASYIGEGSRQKKRSKGKANVASL
ncbi:MAG: hypothetical protein Q9201_003551 [Fulgogasparrea decipioides]